MRMPLFAAAALGLLATPALAASSLAVKLADLDLDSAAGKATLDARINKAARRFCANEQQTGTLLPSKACLDGVRREVLARVEEYQNRVGKGG